MPIAAGGAHRGGGQVGQPHLERQHPPAGQPEHRPHRRVGREAVDRLHHHHRVAVSVARGAPGLFLAPHHRGVTAQPRPTLDEQIGDPQPTADVQEGPVGGAVAQASGGTGHVFGLQRLAASALDGRRQALPDRTIRMDHQYGPGHPAWPSTDTARPQSRLRSNAERSNRSASRSGREEASSSPRSAQRSFQAVSAASTTA